MPTAERTRADIKRVRRRDERFTPNQSLLIAQMAFGR
jgi:hypothetical protein